MVIILFIFLAIQMVSCRSDRQENFNTLIKGGEFTHAQQVIKHILREDKSLTEEQKHDLSFEIERLERIKKDFTKTEDDVLEYIKKYIADVTVENLQKWENDRSLEYMMIDGEKKYFNRAARNLFRVNKECLQIWDSYHEERKINTGIERMDYEAHNGKIIKQVHKTGDRYVFPVRMRINYTISVNAGAVPDGKTIRCWIPFPREIPGRQTDIRLLKTEPVAHKIADNMNLQRTVYMEKESAGDLENGFSIAYEYTSYGSYVPINPAKVTSSESDNDLQKYLKEEPPHIVFTEEFRNLSKTILGEETNPYRKAQILFKWVNDNTPWASAREYSSIRSLSQYGYVNKHGSQAGILNHHMIACMIGG